jgi:DNA topoisomerase IV, B subunit
MVKKDKTLYTETSIVSETPREFCRRVPSTYLGSSKTNTNLIKEVYANSVDEAVLEHGNTINVSVDIDKNKYVVQDFGQGFLINAGIDENGETVMQRSFDVMNTSGKTSADGVYGGSALGVNGIGAKLTNWLSNKLIATSVRDGEYEKLWFKDGIFQKRELGKTSEHSGTTVEWYPDKQFFTSNEPDFSFLCEYFEEIGALVPNLTTNFTYIKDGKEKKFTYFIPDGLDHLVTERVGDKELFSNRFSIDRTIGTDSISMCLTYTSDYSDNITSFVNLGKTEGGEHISAFKSVFTRTLNKYAQETNKLKAKEKNLTSNELMEGLYVIFNVTTTTVKYDAQNKSRIDSIDANIINQTISGDFATWLINNPNEADIILERALVARRAREASKKAKEKIRETAKKDKTSLFGDFPTSLAEAYPKNRNDRSSCECYIVEGLSAGGTIKNTRDSKFQACYPIRGKILNCLKASTDKVYANTEISGLVKILGLDVDKDTGKLIYNKKKLRYPKIIIACFTGDTKVKSLDGNSYSFKELVDNDVKTLWTYSIDKNGNVVPALAKNIRKIKETNKLVKITLDNGKVIKCTLDHKFMLPDLSYEEAKNLKVGQSLMPIYTKIENKHEMYFDRNSGKYKYTHDLVGNTILAREKEDALNRLQCEEHSPNQNSICVHHKGVFNQNNSLNNTPENLEWLTAKEHFIEHSKHNKSEKGKEYYRELHREGKLKNWGETYNGSEKHIVDVKRAWKLGKYANCYNHFAEYNKTRANKDSCKKSNSNPLHILHSKQTKTLKTIKYLVENNLEVNEENYNYNKCQGAVLFSNLDTLFNSLADAIELSDNVDISNYVLKREQDNNVEVWKRSRVARVINRLTDKGLELNEENYNSVRVKKDKDPKFETILTVFDSYEEAYEVGKHYNHKIVDIEYLDVENEPVYCMEVPEYHNFLLDADVVIHNCDGDSDGGHISLLLITAINWLCPELLTEGHIYRAYSALFKVIFPDGTYILFQDDKSFDAWRENNPNRKYKVTRAKGLGELTKEEAYEQLVNVNTRNLMQLVIPNYDEFMNVLTIAMGDDTTQRSDLLSEYYESVAKKGEVL